ncbi:MAG: hypothetical protein OXJ90_27580 [Spirochaetaceae bacterium]|nr:hypothetical protein [Spirochaetaceae bacterium]
MAQGVLVKSGGAGNSNSFAGASSISEWLTAAVTQSAQDNHSMSDTVVSGIGTAVVEPHERTDAAEMIKTVERRGLDKIADRLLDLREICNHDPDEPDIEVESLSTLANFFVDHGVTLPTPRISVSPDGRLVAEWKTKLPNDPESGAVAIEFLRHGWVRFVAFGATSRKKGTKRTDAALFDLQPFFRTS